MSWPLASFGLLGLALAGGLTWYERSRPDARVLALVGTLAAFAALGRIAFAAVPNVKPTTDIVLCAGFALGGAPGFAVGAIAGLTSNFFFGQGPWTPWQMAAWGATGLIGAGLARICPRRDGVPGIGRWPLALVCCVTGFAFTAVQDAGDWVTYSDHRLAALGVYVGQGLGFDAVHAAGCLGFALIFGPALIRALQRFARRTRVVWLPPPTVAPALLVGLALAALALAAAHPRRAAASTARVARAERRSAHMGQKSAPHPVSAALAPTIRYLERAQNRDGGLGAAPGQPSNPLFSGWGALGLAAAGVPIAELRSSGEGPTLLGYVKATAAAGADPGSLERTILVAVAAGADPRSFAGRDLVTELRRRFSPAGAVSGEVNLTAFGLLALWASGSGDGSLVTRARGWLISQADRDGGYGYAGRGGASDPDDTGAVLEALGGPWPTSPPLVRARRRAVAWLRRAENPDGGFSAEGESGSNAQSTAWALQGLIAAGALRAPAAAGAARATLRAGRPSPLAYLRGLVTGTGLVRYARGTTQTPVWVSGEVLMALAGRPLPLAAPRSGSPHRRTPPTGRGRTRSAARDRPRPGPSAGARGAPAGRTAPGPVSRSPRAGSRRGASRRRRLAGGGIADAVRRMERSLHPLPMRIVRAARLGPA